MTASNSAISKHQNHSRCHQTTTNAIIKHSSFQSRALLQAITRSGEQQTTPGVPVCSATAQPRGCPVCHKAHPPDHMLACPCPAGRLPSDAHPDATLAATLSTCSPEPCIEPCIHSTALELAEQLAHAAALVLSQGCHAPACPCQCPC
jgi:hypothetical protein